MVLRSIMPRFVLLPLAVALGTGDARAADPYRINVIVPLTGGASFLGKGEQQALQLLQAVTNKDGGLDGRPLEFVFHDDQSTPQTTVQIANSLLPDKPSVMLGSSIVAMCNAIAPLV